MPALERRRSSPQASRQLECELSLEQLLTLRELEQFGWELKLLRHPPFQPTIAIVFDSDRRGFGVIDGDGNLNEQPDIELRGT